MKKFEFEQNSLEWLQMKWGKIGGTRAKQLFIKSDALFIELCSELSEQFELEENTFVSPAMERGQIMELQARNYLENEFQTNFLQYGWIQSDFNKLLGISPDGLRLDNKTAIEIKCLGRKKHYEILVNNEIPLEHIHQCIHYFTVIDELEELIFCAYRPEAIQNFTKFLNRDSFVNVGTNAKPVIKTVQEAVIIQKTNLLELNYKLDKFFESIYPF